MVLLFLPYIMKMGKNSAHMGIGAFSIQASLLGFLSKKSIGYYILNFYIRMRELISVASMFPIRIGGLIIEKASMKKKDIFPSNI